jgi:hypothetical protein
MVIERSLVIPKKFPASLDNVSHLVLPWKGHFVLKMVVLWMLAVISGSVNRIQPYRKNEHNRMIAAVDDRNGNTL